MPISITDLGFLQMIWGVLVDKALLTNRTKWRTWPMKGTTLMNYDPTLYHVQIRRSWVGISRYSYREIQQMNKVNTCWWSKSLQWSIYRCPCNSNRTKKNCLWAQNKPQYVSSQSIHLFFVPLQRIAHRAIVKKSPSDILTKTGYWRWQVRKKRHLLPHQIN